MSALKASHTIKSAKLRSEQISCSQSPVGLCSRGTITEEGGILNGTTEGTVLSLKYLGSPTFPSWASWTEDAAIITSAGTFNLYETGVIDLGNGQFHSHIAVVGGTDSYANATGILNLRGSFTDPTHFQAEVSGEIRGLAQTTRGKRFAVA